MRRDDLYLGDLVEYLRAVRRYVDDGGADWLEDEMRRDAILHRLIVIGEIAGAVSADLWARHPDVPWARMRAFRNTATHEYFSVDWQRVAQIAVNEVTALIPTVITALQQDFPETARQYEGRI